MNTTTSDFDLHVKGILVRLNQIKKQKSRFFFRVFFIFSIFYFLFSLISGDSIHFWQDSMHFERIKVMYECFLHKNFNCKFSFGYPPNITGYPLFTFYPPLPYLLYIPFYSLNTNPFLLIKIMALNGFLLMIFAVIFLGLSFKINPELILLLIITSTFNQYRISQIFLRGAINEFYASIILFFIITFLISFNRKFLFKKKFIFFFSIINFTLLLTHPLSFILGQFLIITISILFNSKHFNQIIWYFKTLILTFIYSSFYLIPFLVKIGKTYNYLSYTGFFSFDNHFLSFRDFVLFNKFRLFSDKFFIETDGFDNYFSIGFSLLTIIFLILTQRFILKKKISKKIYLLFIFSVFFIFLSTEKSEIFWRQIKFLKFFQYPFRFLNLSIVYFVLALTFLFKNKKNISPLISLILIVNALVNVYLPFFKNKDNFSKLKPLFIQKGEKLLVNNIYQCYVKQFSKYDFLPNCITTEVNFYQDIKYLKDDFEKVNDVEINSVNLQSNKMIITVRKLKQTRGKIEKIILPAISYENLKVYYNKRLVKHFTDKKSCLVFIKLPTTPFKLGDKIIITVKNSKIDLLTLFFSFTAVIFSGIIILKDVFIIKNLSRLITNLFKKFYFFVKKIRFHKQNYIYNK